MEDTLRQALNAQANHEYYAAACYEAMAIWCKARDYKGFAGFFKQQAAEEREHAEKFIEHLLDRGVEPQLTAVPAPTLEFDGLVAIAAKAIELETLNTNNIENCYAIAVAEKDYKVQPLLMWFIEEQVEEEAWAASMLTLTQRAECPGAAYSLDRHIVKELAADD